MTIANLPQTTVAQAGTKRLKQQCPVVRHVLGHCIERLGSQYQTKSDNNATIARGTSVATSIPYNCGAK